MRREDVLGAWTSPRRLRAAVLLEHDEVVAEEHVAVPLHRAFLPVERPRERRDALRVMLLERLDDP